MSVREAIWAYVDLLRISHNEMGRLQAQRALCFLRDYIAEQTGADPEEVQVTNEAYAAAHPQMSATEFPVIRLDA